jgi:glycosyltransferase involved in cell wall biosynthesis
MSIYIITYPKGFDEPGGGTKSFLQIAQNLQNLGVEVITVPVSNLVDGGVPDKAIMVRAARPHKFHYLLNGIPVAKAVREIISEREVDAVLSWEHEAAFMSDFLRSKNIVFGMIAAHPSYQIRVDGEQSLSPLKKISNSWFRWRSLKSADVVFVSSNFTRNELVRLFQIQQNRIVLTHRGIDNTFAKIERLYSEKMSNFIFYGSLAPIKGVFDVIKALDILSAKGERNWQLKIAGWGDEVLLKRAISDRNLNENVVYLGSLTQDRLLHELAWADLAILPSQAESFGRSIAEAQAAGLPVLSYQAGSVSEIVEDGVTGQLVPLGRVDLLADAILKAINNPLMFFEMGLAGRDRVTKLFSWEQTALSIHKAIQEIKRNLC